MMSRVFRTIYVLSLDQQQRKPQGVQLLQQAQQGRLVSHGAGQGGDGWGIVFIPDGDRHVVEPIRPALADPSLHLDLIRCRLILAEPLPGVLHLDLSTAGVPLVQVNNIIAEKMY